MSVLASDEDPSDVQFHVDEVLINKTFDESVEFPDEIAHIGGVDLVTTKEKKEVWISTHTKKEGKGIDCNFLA